ncbi:hypothetical protein [Aeromicrobium sp. 179-A 4D2 NHS]|uniref:hypothetical protein n=1 Tax=Aeromicrobium sp. 179-A 4D2 NHS TaxID=3142375 RepID=UPI00399FBA3B
MSTKIYDAYRLGEGTNAFEFINHVRPLLNAEVDRLDAVDTVIKAVRVYDQRVTGEPATSGAGDTPLSAATFELLEEDTKKHKDPDYAGVFTMGVAEHDGRVYVKVYTVHDELTNVLTSIPGVEDFHYQNSTEGPDDLSDDEWDHRRDVWDAVLGWKPPVEQMLFFTLRGPYNGSVLNLFHGTDWSLYDAALNDREVSQRINPKNRAAVWVRALALEVYFKASGKDFTASGYMNQIGRVRKDENLLPIIKYVAPLFPALTPLDLTGEVPVLTTAEQKRLATARTRIIDATVAAIRRI